MKTFQGIGLLFYDKNKYARCNNISLTEFVEKIRSQVLNESELDFIQTYANVYDIEELQLLKETFLDNIESITNTEIVRIVYYLSSALDFEKYYYLYPRFYFSFNNYKFLRSHESLIVRLYEKNVDFNFVSEQLNHTEFEETYILNKIAKSTVLEEINKIIPETVDDEKNIDLVKNLISTIGIENLEILLIKFL
ncbi:hypothetical protein ASG01_15105 [Chryseobacterium sp. Leaf180]|uniref:hypothetical protein n=1 Tax=Chryseobacterium sp. Leaf180 TaxID=1736289 RepID=UPI0006FD2F6C|nr:hypothetical protein [Chryseobacterium sp. Leaf180]KQR90440.1 hypothetical protein ASG01_15105 [Chryseobacterium sp. Leaf180]